MAREPEEKDDAPEPRGKRPRGSPRKSYLLRLDPKLLAELRSWANQEFRSLNAHLEYLLSDALRRRKGGGEK